MGSYVPSTEEQRREMLHAIGLNDVRDLYRDVPESMILNRPLDLPEGKSELEVSEAMKALAAKNTVFKTVFNLNIGQHFAAIFIHSFHNHAK